jgi:hypothetical protein
VKRPAVHDHAITEEVPSALSASRRERASGFPSMIQFGRIGSGASSMSAGAAKTIGSDMALPRRIVRRVFSR